MAFVLRVNGASQRRVRSPAAVGVPHTTNGELRVENEALRQRSKGLEQQLQHLIVRWRTSTALALATISSLEEEVATNLEHLSANAAALSGLDGGGDQQQRIARLEAENCALRQRLQLQGQPGAADESSSSWQALASRNAGRGSLGVADAPDLLGLRVASRRPSALRAAEMALGLYLDEAEEAAGGSGWLAFATPSLLAPPPPQSVPQRQLQQLQQSPDPFERTRPALAAAGGQQQRFARAPPPGGGSAGAANRANRVPSQQRVPGRARELALPAETPAVDYSRGAPREELGRLLHTNYQYQAGAATTFRVR